jgi:DNA-binding transcriptional ArsR family regulator
MAEDEKTRIEGDDELVAELEEGAEEIREQRESAEQESETMSKESKAAQGARTREAVLAAIKSGRRSRGEIAAEVGVSTTTVDQAGKRLIDEGLVQRGRRGTFVLVGESGKPASPSESSKSAPATTASIAGPLKRVAAKHFARKPRVCVEPVASPLMPVVAPVPVRLEALMGMRVHVGGLVVEVPSIEQLEAIVARWGSK